MSTAGKVLVVLVLLVIPIWIVLIATVAQLNNEGTQAVARLRADLEKLETQVSENDKSLAEFKNMIGAEQENSDRQQAVIRAQLAEIERAKSDTIEIQTRVNLGLDLVKAQVVTATKARDDRKEELKNETAGKAAAEMEVAKLKGQNSELMDQLAHLRDEFKSTVDENRKLVELLKSKTQKPARRTSLVR